MDTLKKILNFIYPSYCQVCSSKLTISENFICLHCLEKIKEIHEPVCKKCARQLAFNNMLCPECKNHKTYLKQMWSYALYSGTMKKLIHNFKYKKRKYLLTLLTPKIIDVALKIQTEAVIDFIVPVPLCKIHFKKRNFNQSFLIADIISRSTGIKISSCLERVKITEPQHKLPRHERFKNVENAFILSNYDVSGKNILIVDDIFTTGATLNECANTLIKGGVNEVFGFTLARSV